MNDYVQIYVASPRENTEKRLSLLSYDNTLRTRSYLLKYKSQTLEIFREGEKAA